MCGGQGWGAGRYESGAHPYLKLMKQTSRTHGNLPRLGEKRLAIRTLAVSNPRLRNKIPTGR